MKSYFYIYCLPCRCSKLRGTLSDEEATKLLCELESIPAKVQEILDGKGVIQKLHSEAFAAGELKHGPIALIDSQTLVVAIASEPKLYDKIGSNMVEVKSRGATIMVITQDDGGAFESKADLICKIPECSSILASLLTIIPAQLFAYYCAVLRGFDPDKPRNLAKSVTVE